MPYIASNGELYDETIYMDIDEIINVDLMDIDENKTFITKIKDVANGKEIDLQGISRNWVISEIFAFGGELSVLEPEDLKFEVASRAKSRLDEDF